MSTHDARNYYFSGQGVVMMGRRDTVSGEPLGLRPIGNVPALTLSMASTVVEHKGSQDGQRATDARLQTELRVTCSITGESWSAVNLAAATRGTSTTIPASTAVDEAITIAPGLVTGFEFIKVSSVVVKQGANTLVVYVDEDTDWDYKLNAAAGSILLNDGLVQDFNQFAVTSPTTDVYDATVSYAYEAQFLVDALTRPLPENWLRFEGLNTVDDNKPCVVEVFRFSNDPLRELALLNDAFGQFVIEGSVLKDDTRPSDGVHSKYFQIRKLE